MAELICCLLTIAAPYLLSRDWPEFTEMAAACKNRLHLNLIREMSTSGTLWGRECKYCTHPRYTKTSCFS